jgi:hypothetical protein
VTALLVARFVLLAALAGTAVALAWAVWTGRE